MALGRAQLAACDQAQFQQEQRQHPLEGIDEHRLDRRHAGVAGHRADQQATHQQQHALAQQHLMSQQIPAYA